MSKKTIRTEDAGDYAVDTTDHKNPRRTAAEDAIIGRAMDILRSRMLKADSYITSPADSVKYLQLRLEGLQHEVFGVLYLNHRHGVIALGELFRGTIDGASVWPREVVKSVLANNASRVVFYHNHPGGIPDPSGADIALTKRLVDALALIDVRVLDHIIIANDEHYSLAEHGQI